GGSTCYVRSTISSGTRTPICTATRHGIRSPLRSTGHLARSPSGALGSCWCGRGSVGRMPARPTGPSLASGPAVTRPTAPAPTAPFAGSRPSAARAPHDRGARPRPSGGERERRGRAGQALVEEEPRPADVLGPVAERRANARASHRTVV